MGKACLVLFLGFFSTAAFAQQTFTEHIDRQPGGAVNGPKRVAQTRISAGTPEGVCSQVNESLKTSNQRCVVVDGKPQIMQFSGPGRSTGFVSNQYYPDVMTYMQPAFPPSGPEDHYFMPAYGYSYPAYGYNYGYYGPALLEPCRNFPDNRSCTMGKVKIDYRHTSFALRSELKKLGLPENLEIDMYTARINPETGQRESLLVNRGPVTKHNNLFNKPYRLPVGTYVMQFVMKSSKNVLFEDRFEVQSDYLNHGEDQIIAVSPQRLAIGEPDRIVIEKRDPHKITLEQWRKGGGL